MNIITKSFVIIFILVTCTCCKNRSGYRINMVDTASNAFEKGKQALDKSLYHDAAEYFTQVYFLNPAAKNVEQASYLEIYSLFMAKMFNETIDACDFALKLYPASDKKEFIEYIKALSYYMQIEPVYLDQTNTEKAKEVFNEFITRYPKSPFINFAKEKMLVINDHLAGKEMDVGRYYLSKNDPISAVIRFRNVIKQYPQSNQVPESLHRLVESYLMMNIKSEAAQYAIRLGNKFPDTRWYHYTYHLFNQACSSIIPVAQTSHTKSK